jgi:hypothetical protein
LAFTPHHAPIFSDFCQQSILHNAGAFSHDSHLFQTSSWRVPRILCATIPDGHTQAASAPHQNLLFKITQMTSATKAKQQRS